MLTADQVQAPSARARPATEAASTPIRSRCRAGLVCCRTSALSAKMTCRKRPLRNMPSDALTREGSWGLKGLLERALMLGGRLTVENAPGAGARVSLHVPMQSDAAPEGAALGR